MKNGVGRRNQYLAGAVWLGLALFSGVTAQSGDPVTITWLGDSGWTDPKPIIAKFEADNPDIKVQYQAVPFEQLFQQTQTRLSSGSGTLDVVSVDAPLVAAYGLQGFLAPLDSAFSKDELGQYLPASISTGFYGGKLLAPPLWNSTQLLYYNKDLLKKAGVPFPSSDPAKRITWEQMVEAAKKTVAKTGGRTTTWGFVIEQTDRPYQLLPLPESLGGEAIGKDGLSVQGVINSPAWVKAFTFYQNLFNAWGISPKSGAAPAPDLFASGNAAFMWAGPWNLARYSKLKDLNWGYAPQPYFAGGKAVTPNDSWHLGVNKNSAKFDAAVKFIKYMTLGAGQDEWIRTADTGPVLKRTAQAVDSDPVNANFPDSLRRLAAFEVGNTAVPRPTTPGFTEYQDVLTKAFSDIRLGRDPKQALDDAARQLERTLAKYRK